MSFVTATRINYASCRNSVFRDARFPRPEEVVRLFVIAIVGLGLNTALVWILPKILQFDPTLDKILAVFPVCSRNFIGRRSVVFYGSLPLAIALVAKRVHRRNFHCD
jgi:putative flippase GtrA